LHRRRPVRLAHHRGRPLARDARLQKLSGSLSRQLRWGILGTGAIAHRFATELRDSRGGRLVAVGSRAASTADAFGRAHGVDRRHATYEALLADDEVDVVYISTPHPLHARWAVLAAEAGKHVLCEKPLTLHRADTEAVIEAARRHGVFLMEAFMYRCHPQTLRLQELLRDGAVGEVRVIEAVHSFKGSPDPAGRLVANELGGGAILDVGCYCMSGTRLVAGDEPELVTGAAQLGSTGVDETAVASLRFPSGIVAHLATGVTVDQPPALRVHGTEGSITLSTPWLPGIDGARRTEIGLVRPGRASDVIEVHADRGLYALEADEVADCIERGDVESPRMTWADTLGNAAALDRWRRAVGVVYEAERPANLRSAVHGRRVAVRAPAMTST